MASSAVFSTHFLQLGLSFAWLALIRIPQSVRHSFGGSIPVAFDALLLIEAGRIWSARRQDKPQER